MKAIYLTDKKGRSARVGYNHAQAEQSKRYTHVLQRFIKSPLHTDISVLSQKHGLDNLSELIASEDIELDLELMGKPIDQTRQIKLSDNKPCYLLSYKEHVYNASGVLTEIRPHENVENNVNTVAPLKWSNFYIKKQDACKRFVFKNALQLQHVDSLTYDFLYNVAVELEEAEAMVMIGGREPIRLLRNGMPYRAFLEGRTLGESYQLILHLSNQELTA